MTDPTHAHPATARFLPTHLRDEAGESESVALRRLLRRAADEIERLQREVERLLRIADPAGCACRSLLKADPVFNHKPMEGNP